jgi:hypothetical protein
LNVSQRPNFDYSWLSRDEFIFISHRGGKYYQTGANTKTTITDSLTKSSQFIEVDLILDGEDIVCLSNEVFHDDSCDLNWIINLLIENDFFLVIDIKSDVHDIDLYREFYEKIVESKNFSIIKNRIIPQAYNFQHLKILDQLDFSVGPIFTTYKTNIPFDLIYKHLPLFGVKVIAMPISEIKIIENFQDGDFIYFTYPVTTHEELLLIEKSNIRGIYTPIFEELEIK